MLAERPVGSPAGIRPARASWDLRLSVAAAPWGVPRHAVSPQTGSLRAPRGLIAGRNSMLTHSVS